MLDTEDAVLYGSQRLNRLLLIIFLSLYAFVITMGGSQLPSADLEVVLRAISGDDDAFTLLFVQYHQPIFRYLVQMIHNWEDADDLTALTFTRAWYSLPKLQNPRSFRPWLYKIANSVLVDFIRQGNAKKHGRHEYLGNSEDYSDEELPRFEERIEAGELVGYALQQLPFNLRQCLLLYIEGLSNEEIARVLNISPRSVGTYLSVARRRFLTIFNQMKDAQRE